MASVVCPAVDARRGMAAVDHGEMVEVDRLEDVLIGSTAAAPMPAWVLWLIGGGAVLTVVTLALVRRPG